MSAGAPRNPWVRFGWVMPTVWLVFLLYPATSVLHAHRPLWVKSLGMLDILAFAVIFVVGCARFWNETFTQSDRGATASFWALMALAALLTPVIGTETLGISPFLVSFLAFTATLSSALTLTALVWVVVVAVQLSIDNATEWSGLLVTLGIVTLATFATRVANTKGIDYDRAMEKLRLAGERERVARDVHDVLGHSLTVVAVKTELAEKLLDVDVERARAELAEIRTLTRTALAEIRETVGGLRVASLADEVDSARMALRGAGIDATLPDDLTVVDPRHRTVLAWTMREAVTNVVRHSGATACRVTLGPDRLVVEDDGRGVRGRREGNGIRGLRERVAGVGGTVSLSPGQQGRGTRVEVTL